MKREPGNYGGDEGGYRVWQLAMLAQAYVILFQILNTRTCFVMYLSIPQKPKQVTPPKKEKRKKGT